MARLRTRHTHRFSIADKDAVHLMFEKMGTPNGSADVDGQRLYKALEAALRRYDQANQDTRRAFFHGLLTGYAVGLKHK